MPTETKTETTTSLFMEDEEVFYGEDGDTSCDATVKFSFTDDDPYLTLEIRPERGDIITLILPRTDVGEFFDAVKSRPTPPKMGEHASVRQPRVHMVVPDESPAVISGPTSLL